MKKAWVVVLIPLALTGCGRNGQTSFGSVGTSIVGADTGPALPTTDVLKLADDYQADEAAADASYKGKAVVVKGVWNIASEAATGKKYFTFTSSGGQAVRCDLQPPFEGSLPPVGTNLIAGVYGTCQGKQVLGGTSTVLILNCKMVVR